MDIPTDIWGQLALEANQVYLTESGEVRSPFANTVMLRKCVLVIVDIFFVTILCLFNTRTIILFSNRAC